ncbi:hypothetical protein LOK49_LG06G02462 [Camellia lanceoleosa]|uniref:Uncharacterized protein n=1 Tax=Camellia lanceoleosa TaxID=1840588 RepID=A0ACC0HAS9_9ERIC|nr:hypothetical protein LOK49_LG06G02462 [Camellia lanceoleosa]
MGTWRQNLALGGLGVVCRDEQRRFMGRRVVQVKALNSVMRAEALAAREAVQLGLDMRFPFVELEGDLQAVIGMLNGVVTVDHRIRMTIDDIKCLRKGFGECRFSFFRREQNNAAHIVAKFAVSCGAGRTSWDVTPYPGCLDLLLRMVFVLCDSLSNIILCYL